MGRGWPELGAAPGILWRCEACCTRRHPGRTLVGLAFDMESFLCQLVKPSRGREATQERRAAEERRVLRRSGSGRPLFVGRGLGDGGEGGSTIRLFQPWNW